MAFDITLATGGPPPSFNTIHSPSYAPGSLPPTRTQSSNSAQSDRDRTSSIEEHGKHSGLLRHSPIANSSLQRNETPTDPVSTAPAGVRHVRFDLNVNQPNGPLQDQSPASLMLHPDCPTEPSAESWLDIPPGIGRPPSPFDQGSVASVDAYSSLDIPLGDGKPPSPFGRGFVSRDDACLSLDVPLGNEGPPGPFNGFRLPSAAAAATESPLVIPLDNERPSRPFNVENERPPSHLDHGSLHIGTHYAKAVTNTSHGRRSISTLSFVSLTRPLFT